MSALLKGTRGKIGVIILVGFFVMLIAASFLIPYSPYSTNFRPNSPPSLSHLLGTDSQGHDVLSQLVWGAYPSLFVAVLASFGAMLLGFLTGTLAGYYPKAEALFSGISDVVITFPALALLVLIGMLYPDLGYVLIFALILVLWPPISRAIRSQVLSVRTRQYVDAAKVSGMSNPAIIYRIIIPETVSIGFAFFLTQTIVAILITVSLEFLGVGNPTIVSWGSIFYWAQQTAFSYGDWWWVIGPGILIAVFVFSLTLIGFSVEEAMHPRLRS